MLQRLGGPQGMNMEWQVAPSSPSSYIVKRILRLDIPVDSFPNVSHAHNSVTALYEIA